MFSSWLSHGSSCNFIFTHISVLGVCQISSPMPTVGRELLFKVLCGWSPSVRALLPLLGVDLGCRGHGPWFNAVCFPSFFSSFRVLWNNPGSFLQGFWARGSLWFGFELGAATNKQMVSYLGNVGLCFSQFYFHFVINIGSFINLNWFPETDPGSRTISQRARQACQQRWGCILKIYLPEGGL